MVLGHGSEVQSLVLNPVPRSAAPAPNPPPWPVSPQVPCAECLLCWQPRQELRGLGEQAREGARAPSVQQQPAGLGGPLCTALKQGAPTPGPQSCSLCTVGCSPHPWPPPAGCQEHPPPRSQRQPEGGALVRGAGLAAVTPGACPGGSTERGPRGAPRAWLPVPLLQTLPEASTPGLQGSRCPSPSGSAHPPVSCGLSSWALAEGQMLTAEAPPGPHRLQRAGVAASHQNRGRAFGGHRRAGGGGVIRTSCEVFVTLVYK